MQQVEAYSLATGLKIGKMVLEDHFYPLNFSEKYVLVSTGAGVPANQYSWYKLLFDFIKADLKKNGYKTIQVGGKQDYKVGADHDACGKTSQSQYFWLIKNAELVICNDTSILHGAGHYDRKIVSLFGVSHPRTSKAYFGDKDKQIYLTPPEPWKPSYNLQENPKSIDFIKIEEIIFSINKLLNLDIPAPTTLNVGQDFNLHVLESVPDTIVPQEFLFGHPLNLRFDKGGTLDKVLEQLTIRKCTVVTNTPLPLEELILVKPNIESVVYLIDENEDVNFPKGLMKAGIPYSLISFQEESWLNGIKLKYLDLVLIDRRIKGEKIDKDCDGAKFKTNKRILSGNKFYLSYEHLAKNISIPDFKINEAEVIDTPTFWEDVEFHYIFK